MQCLLPIFSVLRTLALLQVLRPLIQNISLIIVLRILPLPLVLRVLPLQVLRLLPLLDALITTTVELKQAKVGSQRSDDFLGHT
jgi:hypothetical protein